MSLQRARGAARYGAIAATLLLVACGYSLQPAAGLGSSSPASAMHDALRSQRERPLYFFSGPPDGALPERGRLTFDAAGNAYGATATGGSGTCTFRRVVTGCGTVFELSPSSGGAWTERVLYSFKDLRDGAGPFGTLTLSPSGAIYGVTMGGGNRGCVPLFWVYKGCGTVFALTRSGGAWKKRTLHTFTGDGDGGNPIAGLVRDADGTLYGTAYCGGSAYASCYTEGEGYGVFFALTPGSGGRWSERVLHAFGQSRNGGVYPFGDLTAVGSTRILGTAANVFEMRRRTPASRWRYAQLVRIAGVSSMGGDPNGGLAVDGAGNIYGAAATGGDPICNCGYVFEASRASGAWTETVLYRFSGGRDGARPFGGVAIGSDGRLYATTANGGDLTCNDGGGCGVAFALELRGGAWTQRVLHTFGDDATDGGMPQGTLAFGARGALFGTTQYGGPGQNLGQGSVFRLAR